MKKGTVLIDKTDVIGTKVNDYKVYGYSGQTYSQTKGGPRARHFYLCKNEVCGHVKVIERGRILTGNTPKRCTLCGAKSNA